MSVHIKRALLSVSDKTQLKEISSELHKHGIELISTGGTKQAIANAGIPVVDVATFTGMQEMLDGRVKTLHPKVHGAILAVRGNDKHDADIAQHNIQHIDLVVANLYPFQQTVKLEGKDFDKCVENIDIGGPAMIRSAAKNHQYVTVITNPNQYNHLVQELQQNKGSTSQNFRKNCAKDAFTLTAQYDTAISDYFIEHCKSN